MRQHVFGEFQSYESDGLVQAFFAQTPFIATGGDAYLSAPHPFLRFVSRITSKSEKPERIAAIRAAFDNFCEATSQKFFPPQEDNSALNER